MKKKSKSLCGWTFCDWEKYFKISPNQWREDVVKFMQIHKGRVEGMDDYVKVRITIEELTPKRRER